MVDLHRLKKKVTVNHRGSIWIIGMKLLHILSCKSHIEIIHSIKAFGAPFSKLQTYTYYEYFGIKAKPRVWHDVDLCPWCGLTCPAVSRLTHTSQHHLWLHPDSSCPRTQVKPTTGIICSEPSPGHPDLTAHSDTSSSEKTFWGSPTYPWSVSSWVNVLVIVWVSHLTQSDWALYCFLFIVPFVSMIWF